MVTMVTMVIMVTMITVVPDAGFAGAGHGLLTEHWNVSRAP